MTKAHNHVLSFRQGMHKEWYWTLHYGGDGFGPFHSRGEARNHALRALRKVEFTGKPAIHAFSDNDVLRCLMAAVDDWRKHNHAKVYLDKPEWVYEAEAMISNALGIATIIDRLNRESHYLQMDALQKFKAKSEAMAAVAQGLAPAK
jgi:hypothetical protein